MSKSGASANSSKLDDWPPGWRWGFSSPALKIPPRIVLSLSSSSIRCSRSTLGPSLRGSRGDPGRRLTIWVPPCSRSVKRDEARIAPRFPSPSPAEGPRRFRKCRSGPAGAVAVAGPWPTGGGGRDPSRPKENFATAPSFLMKWCVKSPRTDGVADDRTRWPCALFCPW